MKVLVTLLSLSLFLSSCGLTQLVKDSIAKQGRLNEQVRKSNYKLSLSQTKTKVIEYFSSWRSVTPDKTAQES
jgi:hypothetical protein